MRKVKFFSWFRKLIFRRSGRAESANSFVAEFEKEKKYQEDKDLIDVRNHPLVFLKSFFKTKQATV